MSGGNWKEMFNAACDGDLQLLAHHVRAGVDVNYALPSSWPRPLWPASWRSRRHRRSTCSPKAPTLICCPSRMGSRLHRRRSRPALSKCSSGCVTWGRLRYWHRHRRWPGAGGHASSVEDLHSIGVAKTIATRFHALALAVVVSAADLAVGLQKLMSPLSRRQASAGVGAGTRPKSMKDWRRAATIGVAGSSPTAAASALPSSACGTCHR